MLSACQLFFIFFIRVATKSGRVVKFWKIGRFLKKAGNFVCCHGNDYGKKSEKIKDFCGC